MVQGFLIHAENNGGWLPGLDARGDIVQQGRETLFGRNGATIEGRASIGVKNGLFPPKYLLSPVETDLHQVWDPDTGQDIEQNQMSYAMSKLTSQTLDATPNIVDLLNLREQPVRNEGRMREWRHDNLNGSAVVLGDRTIVGTDGIGPYYNIWTLSSGNCRSLRLVMGRSVSCNHRGERSELEVSLRKTNSS